MLPELFPESHVRFTSLPVLGPILSGYCAWLCRRGYSTHRVQVLCCSAPQLVRLLQQRGVRNLTELAPVQLRGCAPRARENCQLAALVHSLDRYFQSELLLYPPRVPSPLEHRVCTFATYLEQVRGLAPSTVEYCCCTITEFLGHIGYETTPRRLATLTAHDIEGFVCMIGQRLGRASLKNVVAHLRTFLRFLASTGEAPTGLDAQIDTSRVYRGERLPRALPWKTVCAFLDAIDRSNPRGLRDYTMFLLIATYGLRACDVVELTLDDIDWRGRRLQIQQRKTRMPLWFPLTDMMGTALVEYLQSGRRQLVLQRSSNKPDPRQEVACRQLFLRCGRPTGPIVPTALSEAFHTWAKRSGLPMPFHGVHCLRHSYAVHLLRLGTSPKTIGDLLGHRSVESTWVYLRLAIEDLREVALELPVGLGKRTMDEVAP